MCVCVLMDVRAGERYSGNVSCMCVCWWMCVGERYVRCVCMCVSVDGCESGREVFWKCELYV